MSAGGSTKVVLYALGANLGIAAAKFVGAFFTGSASLLAEAIHSLVDCSNQVFLLVGAHAARKPPTEKHPLGHGREAFFWSFVVAVMLFSMGGLFAIYEGLHKLRHPEPLSSTGLAVIILLVAIVLEGISFSKCLGEIRHQSPEGNLWTWVRRSTRSDLLVIFLEDLAALAGLSIAGVCLGLAHITSDAAWDARGSVIVGVVLVITALVLATEVKSLLIGEAPSKDLRPRIQEIIGRHIPGGQVIRLIAVQLGNSEILVSYKITPGSLQSVSDLIQAINRAEAEVKAAFPQIRWQFVEPDDHP